LGAAGLGAAVALVASPARRSPKRPAADSSTSMMVRLMKPIE